MTNQTKTTQTVAPVQAVSAEVEPQQDHFTTEDQTDWEVDALIGERAERFEDAMCDAGGLFL